MLAGQGNPLEGSARKEVQSCVFEIPHRNLESALAPTRNPYDPACSYTIDPPSTLFNTLITHFSGSGYPCSRVQGGSWLVKPHIPCDFSGLWLARNEGVDHDVIVLSILFSIPSFPANQMSILCRILAGTLSQERQNRLALSRSLGIPFIFLWV